MVYKEITVLPRRHAGRYSPCMRRKDRTITAFHPWYPAGGAMDMDDDVQSSWSPLFHRLPLAHIIRRLAADHDRSCHKSMWSRGPASSTWRHVVQCGSAYTPDDITLKLEDSHLIVSARHERVSLDESSKDVQEMTRNVKIPDDVETDSIECVHRDNGNLVIYGQRKIEKSKTGEAKPDTAANTDSNANTEETSVPETNTLEETSEQSSETNTLQETSEQSSESLTETKDDHPLSVISDTALSDSKLFSMDIPISGFEPSEVTVTCRGRTITMSGEKTEESDNGKTYQSWRRQILLPPNVDFEQLNCRLGQGGMLRLCAPESASEQNNSSEEREVPVLVEGRTNEKEVQQTEMEH